MMRFLYYAIAFWLLLAFSSALISIIGSQTSEGQNVSFADIEIEDIDSDSWKASVRRIENYIAPLPVPKENTEDEQAALADETAEPGISINSGVLVGTVLAKPERALILEPQALEPTVLNLGEEWLSPWKLSAVKRDSVEWTNQDTGEVTEQTLFM